MEHDVNVNEAEEIPADVETRVEAQIQLLSYISGTSVALITRIDLPLFLRESPDKHPEFMAERSALIDKFEQDLVELTKTYFGAENVMTEDDLIALSAHLRHYAHSLVGLTPPPNDEKSDAPVKTGSSHIDELEG